MKTKHLALVAAALLGSSMLTTVAEATCTVISGGPAENCTNGLGNSGPRTYFNGVDTSNYHWFSADETATETNALFMAIGKNPTTKAVTEVFIQPNGLGGIDIKSGGAVGIGMSTNLDDQLSVANTIGSYNPALTLKAAFGFNYIQAGNTNLTTSAAFAINPNGGGVNVGNIVAPNNYSGHNTTTTEGNIFFGGVAIDPTAAGIASGLAVGAPATPRITTSGGFNTDLGREAYIVRQQPNIPGPQPNGAGWVFANGGVGLITNDASYTPASVVGVIGAYDTLDVVMHDTGATSGDATHPYPSGTNYLSGGIGVFQDIGNNSSHLSGANAVGISEFSYCHFAGRCWGENPSMSSDSTSTGILWGVEVDINNKSDHTTGYGITVAGASTSGGTGGTGFPAFAINLLDQGPVAGQPSVMNPDGTNPITWSYGYFSNDGTAATFAYIGRQKFSVAGNLQSNSQAELWGFTTPGGAAGNVTEFVTSNGTWYMSAPIDLANFVGGTCSGRPDGEMWWDSSVSKQAVCVGGAVKHNVAPT